MAICTAFLTLMVYLHCYVPVTKSKFLSTRTDGVTAPVRKPGEVTVVSALCDKEGTYLSSSSFPANASGLLLCCCFSSDSQHHPEPAESAPKRGSSENPLMGCSFSYYTQISCSCLCFP